MSHTSLKFTPFKTPNPIGDVVEIVCETPLGTRRAGHRLLRYLLPLL